MGYRYIGAKTKVLDKVLRKATELVRPGAHIVDLMCGTAAVSAAFRKRDFHVTAVDVMTFCYHHARVALLFTETPEFRHAEAFIKEYSGQNRGLFTLTPYEKVLDGLNNVPAEEGYFWKEFSQEGCPKNTAKPRNYFSPENAKRIDSIRVWIKKLWQEGQIDDVEHSLLLHDLIMAANDSANIAGTYGHYLSRLIDRAKIPLKLKATPVYCRRDSGHHIVLKGYAENLASSITADLCYIDPPYMKRQYAANYHILETIGREDEPEAIGVSGLRPWRDQYSNFCTKTKIRGSFTKIFTEMKCRDFLISYSEDGLLTLDELKELFSKFGPVKVSSFRYKRFKSNGSSLGSELTEYLIHVRVNHAPKPLSLGDF